jgi:enamine deaminase RidA (YjgF/YER057c/UK114 family)
MKRQRAQRRGGSAVAERDREAIVRPGDEWFYRDFHASSAHRVGSTIYISGEIGTMGDSGLPEQPRDQMRAAFQNLSKTLQAAGATWSHVVTMTTYHVGLQSQIEAFVEVRNEYVREPYPAWTAVGVTELHAGALLEVSLVAELPERP